MSAAILDGKALAERVRQEVARDAAAVAERGITPGLAVVLVGDDPASQIYVRNKGRAAEKAAIRAFDHKLPAEVTQEQLLALVHELNERDDVHGILVQLPLPVHVNTNVVLDAIAPHKDVDGFHPHNLGLLAQGRPQFVSCTPKGCMRLLAEAGRDPSGERAVVIGRSVMVGKPMAMLLTNANATVALCHSRTRDLPGIVRESDIVIAAIGQAEMIRGAWIKPGAIVIDVGITRTPAGKLVGDVEFAAAAERAGAITPVPGGVGPMTIACLLENTVLAAQRSVGA